MVRIRVPRFDPLRPASPTSRKALLGSRRRNTRCELALAAAFRTTGIRFRRNDRNVPGEPDFVILGFKVAVFCDGDFWHGRHWRRRKTLLASGHNADYWVKKIGRNM